MKFDILSVLPTDLIYLTVDTTCHQKIPCLVIVRKGFTFLNNRESINNAKWHEKSKFTKKTEHYFEKRITS